MQIFAESSISFCNLWSAVHIYTRCYEGFLIQRLLTAPFLPSLKDLSLVSDFLLREDDDLFLLSNGFMVPCWKYSSVQKFSSPCDKLLFEANYLFYHARESENPGGYRKCSASKRIHIGWKCCCVHSDLLPNRGPLISQAIPWPLSRLVLCHGKSHVKNLDRRNRNSECSLVL